MSGQSLNASPASVARTYVPTRSAPKVAMTVQPTSPTTRRPGATSRRRVPNAYRASTAFATSTATSAMANAKWSVTHAGSSSVRTTMPPRTACESTSGTAAIESRRTLGVERRRRHASSACTTTSTTTTNATKRCEYSNHDSNVGYGSHRSGPHFGQLVHPRPDPVARTNPPTPKSSSVVDAVAMASLWKRVMRLEAVRRNDNSAARVGAPEPVVLRYSSDVGSRRQDRRIADDLGSPLLDDVRERVDPALARFLSDRRADLAGMVARAAVLVD